jgi:hypothetical protein
MLGGLGYRIGERIFDPEQNVNAMMCVHDEMPAVEIIYPADGEGPVDGLVARHANGIVYHLCYATDDLEGALARMSAAKLRPLCVSPPRAAILFAGLRVSFYRVAGIGLIEIFDKKRI